MKTIDDFYVVAKGVTKGVAAKVQEGRAFKSYSVVYCEGTGLQKPTIINTNNIRGNWLICIFSGSVRIDESAHTTPRTSSINY